MQRKDLESIIRSRLEENGQPCTITLSNGEVITARVMTKRLWQNDKTRFDSDMTMLGKSSKDYLVVYLPNVYDFSLCGEDDILTLGAEKYRFVKSSAYYTADKIIYYYCVARKIIGEDENVFE